MNEKCYLVWIWSISGVIIVYNIIEVVSFTAITAVKRILVSASFSIIVHSITTNERSGQDVSHLTVFRKNNIFYWNQNSVTLRSDIHTQYSYYLANRRSHGKALQSFYNPVQKIFYEARRDDFVSCIFNWKELVNFQVFVTCAIPIQRSGKKMTSRLTLWAYNQGRNVCRPIIDKAVINEVGYFKKFYNNCSTNVHGSFEAEFYFFVLRLRI